MESTTPVQNRTMGRHLVLPMKGRGGREFCVAILKYTFAVDAAGVVEHVDRDGAVPDLVDTYNGSDAAKSSIKRPSQLFDHKPGTEVLLLGHAYAPRGGAVSHVDVSLRVGAVAKTVRAHGLRVFKEGTFGGLAPGPAQPIHEPIPLVYELAWGGMDWSDPSRPIGEDRNYVGRGIGAGAAVGEPAPQLEFPDKPIGGGKNTPASFGALHRHWMPRASFAGTYDRAWMETRMPLLPDDLDPRFHVAAPPDQWSEAPLRGDEPIEITGATAERMWRFRLPRLVPGFSTVVEGKRTEHRTHLDTILIDADRRLVEFTFRAATPMPRKHQMLERVLIFEKKLV
jgi:hypothetical protein